MSLRAAALVLWRRSNPGIHEEIAYPTGTMSGEKQKRPRNDIVYLWVKETILLRTLNLSGLVRDDFYLFLRQVIQLIDQLIDLPIHGLDLPLVHILLGGLGHHKLLFQATSGRSETNFVTLNKSMFSEVDILVFSSTHLIESIFIFRFI